MRQMKDLAVMELTNPNAAVTIDNQTFEGVKSGIKLLLHVNKPFGNAYNANLSGRVSYYVPDEALAAFKAAWDSRFTIKGLSEYDGRIYG